MAPRARRTAADLAREERLQGLRDEELEEALADEEREAALADEDEHDAREQAYREGRAGERPAPTPSPRSGLPPLPPTGPPAAVSPPAADDDPEDPRRVAHELVALAHAVLAIAGREDVLRDWCPEELQPAVRETEVSLATAIGALHAEIASGDHDEGLRDAGIGGTLGRPKRKGFRRAVEGLRRLVGGVGRGVQDAGAALRGERPMAVRAWLKSAAGWGKLAVDSITSEIPGGQVLKEALEVILVGVDTLDAAATLPPTATTDAT
jgi:hypothetical protein